MMFDLRSMLGRSKCLLVLQLGFILLLVSSAGAAEDVGEFEQRFCAQGKNKNDFTSDDYSKIVGLIKNGNECAINLGVEIYIDSVNKRNADLAEVMSLPIGEVYASKPNIVLRSIVSNQILNDEMLGALLLVVESNNEKCKKIIDVLQERYTATLNVNDNSLIEIRSKVLRLFINKIDLYKRECS